MRGEDLKSFIALFFSLVEPEAKSLIKDICLAAISPEGSCIQALF